MTWPSSSHHGEQHHQSKCSSHYNRTIFSTTLLLILSLILTVLTIMLSLLSSYSATMSGESSSSGLIGYLTPKQSHTLIACKSTIIQHKAEVACHKAKLLANAPGGVTLSPVVCPITMTETVFTTGTYADGGLVVWFLFSIRCKHDVGT
jgi:hypothetical protein